MEIRSRKTGTDTHSEHADVEKSAEKTRNVEEKKDEVHDLVEAFIGTISKKKVYDVLCEFIENPDRMSDIEVATEISSVLTNSLVEVGKDVRYFEALDVAGQISLLDRYVHGRITKEDVRCFYGQVFVGDDSLAEGADGEGKS